MPQLCKSCSRLNPDEALYCHHDGSVLPAHQHPSLSIKTALRPFLTPLAFPSGRSCFNFEQLLRVCHEEWSAAVDLLRYGHLERFFIQQGRADLAFAARAAAQRSDPEQALDDLIAGLPSQDPVVPRLDVTPLEIFLGGLRVGEDRTIFLRLVNQGCRLICGSVTADCLWLSFGSHPPLQKAFRFPREQTITVHIVGKHLHAAVEPLEGNLEIVSNAGNFSVTVRAEVPIVPFAQDPSPAR